MVCKQEPQVERQQVFSSAYSSITSWDISQHGVQVMFESQALMVCEKIKMLGIVLDKELTFSDHITHTIHSAHAVSNFFSILLLLSSICEWPLKGGHGKDLKVAKHCIRKDVSQCKDLLRFESENLDFLAAEFLLVTEETRGRALSSRKLMEILLRSMGDPGFQSEMAEDFGVERSRFPYDVEEAEENIANEDDEPIGGQVENNVTKIRGDQKRQIMMDFVL
ncbi:hypothetical protein J6590_055308 [Homalodisca vitripennis]|nr:hypothetical protein J6590_055308 [Homalodisca vitripennis]